MRNHQTPTAPPALTDQERAAQEALLRHAETLRGVRDDLLALHTDLGEPPEETEMAEGTRPETVAFSIRGTVECLVSDRLEPAVTSLERTARETPEDLYEEWEERRGRVGAD
jgi:hypothetical protein